MEFVNTKKQALFNLMVGLISSLLPVLIISVVSALYIGKDFEVLGPLPWLSVPIVIIVSLVIFTWYHIMNSGSGAIPQPTLLMDECGIKFTRSEESSIIEWEDFNGVKVSGFINKFFTIKSKAGSNIEFQYYLFSPLQRRGILEILNKHMKT